MKSTWFRRIFIIFKVRFESLKTKLDENNKLI